MVSTYECPAAACHKSYPTLEQLFQHMLKTTTPGHKPKARWLIIDKKENVVYVTDKGPGTWTIEKLRESVKEEAPPAPEIEVPA